jgi:hypothetical protein
MENIKPLPTQFSGTGEVRGYEFAQICKTDRGFLYEVRLDGIITHYEVFELKINNRFMCESYPTSKAFGIWAWTYRKKNDALGKLSTLNEKFSKERF